MNPGGQPGQSGWYEHHVWEQSHRRAWYNGTLVENSDSQSPEVAVSLQERSPGGFTSVGNGQHFGGYNQRGFSGARGGTNYHHQRHQRRSSGVSSTTSRQSYRTVSDSGTGTQEHGTVQGTPSDSNISSFDKLRILNHDGPPLEKEYKPKKREYFVVGKVFQALWSEPAGQFSPTEASIQSYGSAGYADEWTFSKPRRFVIVGAAGAGHNNCLALPILSYHGKGVGKSHQSIKDHGIIHSGLIAPDSMEGEEGMTFLPIRVDTDLGEKLSNASRINYAKVYTVETNIKIKHIGFVHTHSKPKLMYQFRDVWMRRIPDFVASRAESPLDAMMWQAIRQSMVEFALGSNAPAASEEQAAIVVKALDRLFHSGLLQTDLVSAMEKLQVLDGAQSSLLETSSDVRDPLYHDSE